MSLDDCQDVVEVLTDLLDGALSEPDRVHVLTHLEGCDGCREWLEQLNLTVAALGQFQGEERQLPPAVVAAVRAVIDDRRSE